ncbi:MAG: PIN domain-containing protein [Candidatus Pacearchaeota archaeon]|nr:PIN domain-containing protein [Candidatus Pacearchaeota archaeon]
MVKVLIDTNFILSCIRKKIDFFEELAEYEILIPLQVVREIEKITISKKKMKFRDEARLALKILDKGNFTKIDLGVNYVDNGIRKFVKNNPNIIIATLDEDLKRKVNQRLVIRGRVLEVV